MIKRSVNVDFSRKTCKIKPINCLNNGPKFGLEMQYDFSDQYKEMKPAFVRVSSPEAPYSSSRYLDLHCIFPDMALDERFEGSYNFLPTDKYLASIKEVGADIFLRLGESREPYELKKYTRPPRDAAKIARIFGKIIDHYNKGWANGYKWGIKYVEIMCDTDTPEGWGGTVEEYYLFYKEVATYLKEKFPKLKIGAYSSGGFSGLNHYDSNAREKGYVTFLEEFLRCVGMEKTAPLDFLSWKCYADSPEELDLHGNYATSYLNQPYFRKTQSIVTEFCLKDTKDGSYLERNYPSRLARALIVAQKSDIDMMILSKLEPYYEYNPVYTLDDGISKKMYASYHVMTAFSALASLGSVVESTADYRRELYSLAAANDGMGALVFTTENYSGVIEINLENSEFKKYNIKGIIGGGDRGAGFFTEEKNLVLRDNTITLRVGKNEVYFLTFS